MTVDLAQLHTRQLLKALRMTRARNSCTFALVDSISSLRSPDGERPRVTAEEIDARRPFVDGDLLGLPYGERTEVTVEQLKAELAKRPHVPNKQESQALRRAKNLRGRQRGRGDRR